MEENALLLNHFAKHLEAIAPDDSRAAFFRQKSDEAERRAAVLKQTAKNYERTNPQASSHDLPQT
jgi:hypothetical protein